MIFLHQYHFQMTFRVLMYGYLHQPFLLTLFHITKREVKESAPAPLVVTHHGAGAIVLGLKPSTVHTGYSAIGYSAKSDIASTLGW